MNPVDALARLKPLLDGHWYDATAAVMTAEIDRGGSSDTMLLARDLAVAAKRVLDLDAEDYDQIASHFRGSPWADDLASACFPQLPRQQNRGALGSLLPLMALMLEVVDLRAERAEPLQVVVTAHLIGEYLPQLAWESVLGHAGDPLRLPDDVGERWGTDDPACPHGSALRTTARRALNAAAGDTAGFTAYLDRFHSRQGAALAMCATMAGETWCWHLPRSVPPLQPSCRPPAYPHRYRTTFAAHSGPSSSSTAQSTHCLRCCSNLTAG